MDFWTVWRGLGRVKATVSYHGKKHCKLGGGLARVGTTVKELYRIEVKKLLNRKNTQLKYAISSLFESLKTSGFY